MPSAVFVPTLPDLAPTDLPAGFDGYVINITKAGALLWRLDENGNWEAGGALKGIYCNGSYIQFTGTDPGGDDVQLVASHDLTMNAGNRVNLTAVTDILFAAPKTFLGTRIIGGVPATAPSDSDLANSRISMYLDEVGNTLKFRVRYSNGTLKLGSIALV